MVTRQLQLVGILLAGVFPFQESTSTPVPLVAISNPHVVANEPLFLSVEMAAPTRPEKQPVFIVMIDGRDYIPQPNIEWPIHECVAKDGTRTYRMLATLFRTKQGYAITKVGEHKVSVKELGTGVESQSVKLHANEPSAADLEISRALDTYLTEGRPVSQEEKLQLLRSAVGTHGHSTMAKYAQVHLLLKELETQPLLKSNAPEEMAHVKAFYAGLFNKYTHIVSELPKPSVWHCTVALEMSRCQAWNGNLQGAISELQSLYKIYEKFPPLEKTIRLELEAVEKQRQEETK